MSEMRGNGAAPASAAALLPTGLAACRQFLAYLGRAELVLAGIGLAVVVVLSTAQALLRYAFGTSLWWAGEIAQYAVFVSYFLGVSYIFKTRQYILIEFVSYQLPIRVQMVFYCLAQVAAIVFAGGTIWLLFRFLPTLLNMRSPVLSLPAIIAPIPLAFASAAIVLTSLYYLVFGVWALANGVRGKDVAEIEAIALITTPLDDAEEW